MVWTLELGVTPVYVHDQNWANFEAIARYFLAVKLQNSSPRLLDHCLL